MTEYIDRAKTQAYLYKNMMWYDEEGYIAEDSEKDKALWDLVKGVPAADVVEQVKIDKAIAEMTKLLDSTNNIDLENRTYECIEILKKI